MQAVLVINTLTGGMGYMTESRISRRFRDLRLTAIGGGADEVMLEIISKYLQFHA